MSVATLKIQFNIWFKAAMFWILKRLNMNIAIYVVKDPYLDPYLNA